MIRKFKREDLLELGLPYDSDDVVLDEVDDTSRWSVIHNLIFKHEDKYYQTSYSVGATEMQYERPWEYEDEVTCVEVELKEVVVKKWVPID